MNSKLTSEERQALLLASFVLKREAGLVNATGEPVPGANLRSFRDARYCSLAANECAHLAVDPNWRPS